MNQFYYIDLAAANVPLTRFTYKDHAAFGHFTQTVCSFRGSQVRSKKKKVLILDFSFEKVFCSREIDFYFSSSKMESSFSFCFKRFARVRSTAAHT